MVYGTLSVLDDLEDIHDTVADYGEEQVAARFAAALAIHNAAVMDMVTDLGFTTSDYLRPYGGSDVIDVVEVDEHGAADASKITGAGNLGIPLRQFQAAVQWTRTYMLTHSVSKLAKQMDAAAAGDIRALERNFKRALFNNVNNLTYKDVNMTGLDLPLRALLNADGMAIPVGPNGKTFDGSTHTHYLDDATLTAGGISETIDTVVEHGVDGEIRLYISKDDETTVRGFTGFEPFIDARIRLGSADSYAVGNFDRYSVDNRAIGVFDGAEVWVKPWVPQHYQIAFDTGTGNVKPIAIRTRTGSLSGTGAFGIVAEHDGFPLRGQHLMREYGMAPVGRHKAAVHKSNNATYSPPAL